jgi:APA family basic amino acid/polyamine antiporter
VYLSVNAVYLLTLGRDGLAATTTPAADAVSRLFGPGADVWISAAIAISTFGFLDLTLLAPTRILYAMAQDGTFFPALSRLHPRFATPHRAIVLQAVWGMILVLTGTYGGLVDSVVFADWIFFGLTVAAVMVLRRRIPPATRGPGAYLAPGYPLLPILFVAASAFVVVGAVRTNPVRSAIGVALMAAGVPIYLTAAGRASRDKAPS